MRPIPEKLREEMVLDPYYKKCCITGLTNDIEWHHNFIYAGRQVNEKWCVLPVSSKYVHSNIEQFKEKLNWIMLNRADEDTLKKYSKSKDLIQEKNRLNKAYDAKNKTNISK